MSTSASINRVSGLEGFRAAWDEARPRINARENRTSADGHINVEGNARCPTSAIYTPADAEFLDAVEQGVRPLVIFLIDELDCITYSSCEGHPPTADGHSMRARHVGILPRNAADHARILTALTRAAELVDRTTVDLRIVEDVLGSEGPDLPCIDIVFVATSLDWPKYAANVRAIQSAFLDCLRV